jgi:hypothetical protein
VVGKGESNYMRDFWLGGQLGGLASSVVKYVSSPFHQPQQGLGWLRVSIARNDPPILSAPTIQEFLDSEKQWS